MNGLLILGALFCLAVLAYVAKMVLFHQCVPFFNIVFEWSVATCSADEFPPSGGFSVPSKPALSRRDLPGGDFDLVADPFLLKEGEDLYLFAEAWNKNTRRGEIVYAKSADGRAWSWQGTALREEFHLSYPCVFRDGKDIYMIPESGSQNAIFLYQAEEFPSKWKRVATLLKGLPFNDATVFKHEGLWWIFAGIHPYADDMLCLFHSKDLRGPWEAHPMNPIVSGDAGKARPAGRVIESNGKLYRSAQVDWPYYGRDLRLFEITELSRTRYSEKPADAQPFPKPGRLPRWMTNGRHHLDAIPMDGGWLVAFDGFRWAWRFGLNRTIPVRVLKTILSGMYSRRALAGVA